jgi:GH25 family lysozyme M1 (1,4-beta-N-acetylmuramidase)
LSRAQDRGYEPRVRSSRPRRRLVSAALIGAGGVFAVACSMREETSTASPEIELAADAAWPRLCPSSQHPDGSWVTVDGIDVSDWQYTVWDEVTRARPNIRFAIARVSSGTVRIDTRFGRDWAAMKRLGLVRGAYQYLTPRFSAEVQADLFVRRLNEEGGLLADDLPPVLDMEETNGMPDATVKCRVDIWLTRVERALKRLPMVYTSYLWSSYFNETHRRYPLWVTNFVGTPSITCPRMPTPWNTWRLWQHSATGKVPGVYTNTREGDGGSIRLVDGGDAGHIFSTDLNFFDGTMEGLRAFIATTSSTGDIEQAPPLAHPPHVSPSIGVEFDCNDGCCIRDP